MATLLDNQFLSDLEEASLDGVNFSAPMALFIEDDLDDKRRAQLNLATGIPGTGILSQNIVSLSSETPEDGKTHQEFRLKTFNPNYEHFKRFIANSVISQMLFQLNQILRESGLASGEMDTLFYGGSDSEGLISLIKQDLPNVLNQILGSQGRGNSQSRQSIFKNWIYDKFSMSLSALNIAFTPEHFNNILNRIPHLVFVHDVDLGGFKDDNLRFNNTLKAISVLSLGGAEVIFWTGGDSSEAVNQGRIWGIIPETYNPTVRKGVYFDKVIAVINSPELQSHLEEQRTQISNIPVGPDAEV